MKKLDKTFAFLVLKFKKISFERIGKQLHLSISRYISWYKNGYKRNPTASIRKILRTKIMESYF